MTENDMTPMAGERAPCKPRLVLMGEFSAGKSTLSNILLGSRPLPMRVTATRLPPVVIRYGMPGADAVAIDGSRTPIEIDKLEDVCLDRTRRIELRMQAEVLLHCDLVDMPGISDPNMPQHFWEDLIGPNDHVIWCTHATQAWRQSEAAIWRLVQPNTSGNNLLLITQFDKLQSERDRKRVVRRVEHETAGLFEAIYPVSLLAALNAGEDAAIWEESGAAAFSDHVVKMLAEFAEEHGHDPLTSPQATSEADRSPMVRHAERDARARLGDTPAAGDGDGDASRIVPRRVRLQSEAMARERPDRSRVYGMGN